MLKVFKLSLGLHEESILIHYCPITILNSFIKFINVSLKSSMTISL